jgi:hypothetical protein
MGRSVSHAKLPCVVVSCILLVACGGGDGSSNTAATSSGPSATAGGSSGGSTADTGSGGSTAGAGATAANSKPTISGTPSTAAITNQKYLFEPKAQDADGDVLTFRVNNAPPWASFDLATGSLQGTPKPSDVGTYANIVISVTDGAANAALNAFTITVQDVGSGSVELSWQAPTENEDGSPLTDLAGYKLYWGTAPGDYANSVTIDNPGVLNYVVDNLAPTTTYYFVATAFNTGGTESSPSDMAMATL